jgi:hypothetical protein
MYVFLVPFLALLWLWKKRHVLNPPQARSELFAQRIRVEDPATQSSRFLWRPYRPSLYYWETVELCRKLLQASVLQFVYPGTLNQCIYLMSITAAIVVLLYLAKPYEDIVDTHLAMLAQYGVLFIAFLSLLQRFNNFNMYFDDNAIFALMTFTFFIVPLVGFLRILTSRASIWREKCMACSGILTGGFGASVGITAAVAAATQVGADAAAGGTTNNAVQLW